MPAPANTGGVMTTRQSIPSGLKRGPSHAEMTEVSSCGVRRLPSIAGNVRGIPSSASQASLRVTSVHGRSRASFSQRIGSDCSICRMTTPCGQAVGPAIGDQADYVGIFDIFKIGIGPSSSHTMGPMSAGKTFVQKLSARGLLPQVARIEVSLYGSLALTGKGHATDKATVLGLAGYEPATINPDEADSDFSQVLREKRLILNGEHAVHFDFENDLIFYYEIELPCHPNGMTIQAYGYSHDSDAEADHLVESETYYSIGGGFIKTEAEMLETLGEELTHEPNIPDTVEEGIPLATCQQRLQSNSDDLSPASTVASQSDQLPILTKAKIQEPQVPFFFRTAQELLHICRTNHISIAEVMINNECALRRISREDVYAKLDQIASVIDGCVDRGLRMEGKMPVSHIPRRAAQIKRRLLEGMERALVDPLSVSDWIALYARAVNEENACGGRVVTAPTNGAAGTVPAVLTYYRRSVPTSTKQGVRDFLATSAAIGSLCKRNASISGAEAGCQAEVGSACAMAAAGLCAVLGGTGPQIENAAEIGLEHCLGMTCDPIMGLVQIPCIERNCIASIKAVAACRLALVSDGDHEVSLDSCIETMYRTGLDMQSKYRETSTGGLAMFARKMVDF